jgi:hypothetical protein
MPRQLSNFTGPGLFFLTFCYRLQWSSASFLLWTRVALYTYILVQTSNSTYPYHFRYLTYIRILKHDIFSLLKVVSASSLLMLFNLQVFSSKCSLFPTVYSGCDPVVPSVVSSHPQRLSQRICAATENMRYAIVPICPA